jgi:hypothetical protein
LAIEGRRRNGIGKGTPNGAIGGVGFAAGSTLDPPTRRSRGCYAESALARRSINEPIRLAMASIEVPESVRPHAIELAARAGLRRRRPDPLGRLGSDRESRVVEHRRFSCWIDDDMQSKQSFQMIDPCRPSCRWTTAASRRCRPCRWRAAEPVVGPEAVEP